MQDIEDIYELSPMQQGILFHTLYSPHSGVYFEQRSCLLTGDLNVAAFQEAWGLVIKRHSVLRTAFYWEETDKLLQVVYKKVELPWVIEDWRNIEDDSRFEAFIVNDRNRGFDLNEAPLMRCALFRVAEDAYRFVWSCHHLLMDGWCNGILLKEVLDFYEALIQGKNLSLAPTRPYRDYILWLQAQDTKKAQTYWQRSLENFTTPTSLNTKQPQEIYQEKVLKLSPELTERLQVFSQQYHLTLNTIIQGAWALILSRFSGEVDVIFGATVSGRPPTLTGVETIVGLFINTLPTRVKIKPDAQLIPWLQNLQEQQIEREQYSYSSLVDIQGWSEIPRGVSLFESLVVFENYPISLETVLQNWNHILNISDVQGFEQVNYPLTLSIIPSSELLLRISYDIGCFDVDTIRQILEYLEMILAAIASRHCVIASEPQLLHNLFLLTPAKEQQLLIDWNNTYKNYSTDLYIQQLFEVQVEKTPEAIAVIFEDHKVTYSQLNQKANQLANYLIKLGVKPNELIGIYLERSVEMIIAVLGILKAGCAYVPLDTNYPQQRLDYILKETQIRFLLSHHNLKPSYPQIQVIYLDTDWEIIAAYNNSNLNSTFSSRNLAYIIYTSGSTGQPKGVMIEHRSLVSFTEWAMKHYQLSSNDKILQFASLSFDVAAEEIYPSLSSGGTLVLRTEEMMTDLVRFSQELALSILNLPTAYWHQLNDESEKLNLKLPSNIRLVITGGEKVIQSHHYDYFKNSAQLINAYGPTETTIGATSGYITSDLAEIPIGYPIDRIQTYIVDRYLQPVPIGVAGELLIEGVQLARGYFNRPDLTAEKFIPNPFTSAQGERLYKTGDKARYLPDGRIEYLGRLDNQVKIRGFRVELGEIEAVLAQHPDISSCIALTYRQQIVAYIISHGDLNISDLRAFLAEKLPNYAIPAYFVFLESFPLTVNGKIDRRNLPEPNLANELNYIAPRSPVEEIIAGIWANILAVEQVGIEDNFFELGGHSLLATQAISRMRDALDLEIPLKNLFKFPTVASFTQNLTQNSQKVQIEPILPVKRSESLPLSFAQARLWFLAKLEPDNPFYNIAIALRIQGPLQLDRLEQSFNQVIQRHEILRTTFTTDAVQVISPTLTVNLEISEPTQPVENIALTAAQQPFELEKGPLLKISVLRINDVQHILILTIHHIVADGWSLGILVRELVAFYQGRVLETLPIQYADFACWQREYLQGEKLETLSSYWRSQLQGAPSLLELPIDHPRSAIQSFRGSRYQFKLPCELTQSLTKLSQQQGSTLFMTLLATFYILLHRYTESQDIVVGSPIANRNRSEIEVLIGFFVNNLALRVNLAGNPTFEDLLGRVRQVTLDAYTYQDLPFERILDELELKRSLAYSPLFQVMFVLQNTPTETIQELGLTWSPIQIDSGTSKYDLTLSLEETEQGLEGTFEYNTDLFEAATIQRMVESFRILLTAVVKNPDQQISSLPLLNQAEEKQLLVDWNQTQTNYPQDLCIHQLLEIQVAKTPEAIAIVHQEQTFTYQQLNTQANQLAHILQQQGVGIETLVGLCIDRSFNMIVVMLAILKAGGAYVPIDPTYPRERIDFLVKNTELNLVLTQRSYLSQFSEVECLCWENLELQENIPIENKSHPNNLAYIMYTSGSTGVPKGISIPHRGVVRLVKENDYIHFGPDEVFLQAASTSFDAATFEIWGALLNGAKLVLLPHNYFDLAEFRETLQRYQITTVWLTAGLFKLAIDEALESLASVRQLIAGGDALSKIHVSKFLKRYPDSKLVNGYGPTESTTFTCTADLTLAQDSVPIGRPIANTQVYILDSYLQPVPIGVSGELYIGGDGLARNYLNRPDLTAAKFIPNPFVKGERLYRTGDKTRYLPNGDIEYLGRLDRQVKIRGFRIELGEVETVLSQHPEVKETVVIFQENTQRLIAYIVPHQKTLTSPVLRSFLTERLPDYLIPAFFVLCDRLPLTTSGKIDHSMLPEPEITVSHDSPSTPTESKLAEIWASLLNLESVGIHDNFFELGGDSILAIQIINRANQAGLHLTPKQLFQYQTIAELATVVKKCQIIQAEQGLVTGLVPLTPIQRWFFSQNLANPHHFNQAVLLEVKSELNLSYLQQALEYLFLHHDALRLRFEYQAGTWQQINSQEIPVINLEVLNQKEIETIATQLQQSLNLSGELIRVAYFGSRLLFVAHHLIIDGISWRILLEDLQTVYQQIEQGQIPQLPPKTTSFKQWSEYLQKYAYSEIIQKEREYYPIFSLPLDASGENTIASSDTITVILDPESTEILLTKVPAVYNTQINDILLTALTQTFSQWTGSSGLLLDLESHGRAFIDDEIDLSRTVGWFTSILPVYLSLENVKESGQAIKSIKEQLRRIPNQGIGYAESLTPQISFNYLGQFDQMFSDSPYFNLAQESIGSTVALENQRPYLLEINGLVREQQLRFDWTYSKQNYEFKTIEKLAHDFMKNLKNLSDHCQSLNAGGYTPSDFALAELEQDQLDNLIKMLEEEE
ncbi:non-ribosomal peptide synthetase [Gloeocapsa sp. PCC 73106]|uniref:non-ribosomal peptide synthetase n=1 Tax=Gloeocapsa sp. PCC 73106 TaxID=102232 RepID=UPI0002ABDD31|nr:non-ribosomal peptide synthetase [Gloeocapsa sp. PCC 73106]ELR97621.1 non-ribosomal peptide synthase/amino acid adenylation enzyme [Gloeocapsa sp. PCC 73106]